MTTAPGRLKGLHRTPAAAIWCAAVVLAATSACGGDQDPAENGLSADEQTAADNLAGQIVRSEDVSGTADEKDALTDEEASCVAEGAVGEIGLEKLQGYGIVTDDLLVNKGIQGVEMDPADADALAGVFVECIDTEQLFEDQLLSGVPEPTAEQRDCVDSAVDSDTIREILSTSFQGRSSAAYDDLRHEVAACTNEKPGR